MLLCPQLLQVSLLVIARYIKICFAFKNIAQFLYPRDRDNSLSSYLSPHPPEQSHVQYPLGVQSHPPGFQPHPPGFQPHPPGFQPHPPGFQPHPPGFQPRPPEQVRPPVVKTMAAGGTKPAQPIGKGSL